MEGKSPAAGVHHEVLNLPSVTSMAASQLGISSDNWHLVSMPGMH